MNEREFLTKLIKPRKLKTMNKIKSKFGLWEGKPIEEYPHEKLCEIASYLGGMNKMTESGKAARLIFLWLRPSLKRTFRLLPFNEKYKTQWGLMKGWQVIEENEKIIAGFSKDEPRNLN